MREPLHFFGLYYRYVNLYNFMKKKPYRINQHYKLTKILRTSSMLDRLSFVLCHHRDSTSSTITVHHFITITTKYDWIAGDEGLKICSWLLLFSLNFYILYVYVYMEID